MPKAGVNKAVGEVTSEATAALTEPALNAATRTCARRRRLAAAEAMEFSQESPSPRPAARSPRALSEPGRRRAARLFAAAARGAAGSAPGREGRRPLSARHSQEQSQRLLFAAAARGAAASAPGREGRRPLSARRSQEQSQRLPFAASPGSTPDQHHFRGRAAAPPGQAVSI